MYWFLLETAAGYGLFEVVEAEEIGSTVESVADAADNLTKFSRGVKLTAFRAFQDEKEALDNALQVSEGELSAELSAFLEANVKLSSKDKSKRYLGVQDPKLAGTIQDTLGYPCRSNDVVNELVRSARVHLPHFIKGLVAPAAIKAQLGLGHAYSRSKVKFNVNRQDNMIIQAIQLLDQMDKDVNTLSMKVREWYGWHFPELAKLVSDPFIYSRLVTLLGDRSKSVLNLDNEEDEKTMSREDYVRKITEIVGDDDEELAEKIFDAAETSMGMDVSDIDMLNINRFASRVEGVARYRHELHEYLLGKMRVVAPNLNALLGESVGARLIAHAGSLTKLSKCPASTVQILGAEKALFRALKTKGNTPKFGLLFNSSYISRAGAKNKGRISRYLANKCAIASRIDAFSDVPTDAYGVSLKSQVEERLEFYETGKTPQKNIDVMKKVKSDLGTDDVATPSKKDKKEKKEKKEKKRSREEAGLEEAEEDEDARRSAKKAKKEKKRSKDE